MDLVTGEQEREWHRRELASLAWSMYRGTTAVRRLHMLLRPFNCPFERLMDFVPEESSILDVGCGAGAFLGLLAATGRRIHGVGFDKSAVAIHDAHAMADCIKARGCVANLRFDRIDVESAWPEGPFDVVSMIDVIHHVPVHARRAVFEMAHASLRPGGQMIYKDIADRPRWRAEANRLHDLLMSREWITYTPLRDIQIWAEQTQMKVQPSERINRLWYANDLLVLKRS